MGELFGAAIGFYLIAMIVNWLLGKFSVIVEPRRVAISAIITIVFATIAGAYGNADKYGIDAASFIRSYLVYAQGGFWFLLAVFIGKVKE